MLKIVCHCFKFRRFSMKKLIALLLLVSMLVLPSHAAVSTTLTPIISFGQVELPEGATAWGAVYDENQRMIHMAAAAQRGGEVRIPIPEKLCDAVADARLFVLQDSTLIPLHSAVPAVSGPVTDTPYIGPNTVATVKTGKLVVSVDNAQELAEALDPSGNSVVTLLKDITSADTVSVPYSCTLDLNGFTLEIGAWNIMGTGAQNKITTIQNGTLVGDQCALMWRDGGLVIRNTTLHGKSGSALWILNHAEASPNAGDFQNVNLIENSTLLSSGWVTVSFNSSDQDFSNVVLRIKNSDLISAGSSNVLYSQGGSLKPGSILLDQGVNFYTAASSAVKTGAPAPCVYGKTAVKQGTSKTHSITVLDSTLTGLYKWSTGDTAATAQQLSTVLLRRRYDAEAYLRALCAVRWRSDVDLSYTHTGNGVGSRWNIVKGRLYEGLPYSYAGASLGAWLDHPGTMDEDGVYNMTGLSVALIGGTSTTSRIGIDCSGTLSHAWQSIGAQVRTESTNAMTPNSGFLKVGDYEAPESSYTSTKTDCTNNGASVMYEAYALLQKADGIVTSNDSGHARFVVDVNVVRNADGTINGTKSTVTVIEQFGIMSSEAKYYDEDLQEYVYLCMTVDKTYSFSNLYDTGYLPVTCKELIDPSPIAEPVVTDSVTTPTISNLFSGTISSTWALDNVTITITDSTGKVVQSSLMHPQRRTELAVKMSQFITDGNAGKLVGVINTSALAAGRYHCTVTARTVAGHILTVRSFDFTR